MLPSLASLAAAAILGLAPGTHAAAPASPPPPAPLVAPSGEVGPSNAAQETAPALLPSLTPATGSSTSYLPAPVFTGSGIATMVPASLLDGVFLSQGAKVTFEPAFSASPEHQGGGRAMLGIIGRF
jgi:hypothetical protein